MLLLGVWISVFQERVFVIYDDSCNFCIASVNILKKFKPRSVFVGISKANHILAEEDFARVDFARCKKEIWLFVLAISVMEAVLLLLFS